ncbi:hypothetical protein GGD61_007972 [Bradyrhizobium sp. SBR1B]|nr:hypothetical protein [Bradyrhizobium sp. SBR1B]
MKGFDLDGVAAKLDAGLKLLMSSAPGMDVVLYGPAVRAWDTERQQDQGSQKDGGAYFECCCSESASQSVSPVRPLAVLNDPTWRFDRIGLKAGPLSQWLFSGLAEAGLPASASRHGTIPGVGPVTSLAFISTIDVPARFKSSKAVGPSLGLTPVLDQSGESHRIGRISLCGDQAMRALLYEAAQVMLTRVQKWSWLKAWAMQIAK